MNCGWLVENGKNAPDLRYRTMEQGMWVWTADHNIAVRYARREDAERVHAEDEDAWRIVEHCWMDRELTSAPPVEQAGEPVDDETLGSWSESAQLIGKAAYALDMAIGKRMRLGAQVATTQPTNNASALVTACCGRKECGGECGNEWRGMESPLLESAIALIVRDVCELDPADPAEETTVCVSVADLEIILKDRISPLSDNASAAQGDIQVPQGLVEALRNGSQCDEDGVEIRVSRQAVEEAATILERLQSTERVDASVTVDAQRYRFLRDRASSTTLFILEMRRESDEWDDEVDEQMRIAALAKDTP